MTARTTMAKKAVKKKPAVKKRVAAPVNTAARQRVERLYWRAGFGALPREVDALARPAATRSGPPGRGAPHRSGQRLGA